jgi:tRNA (guanine6-N2)-methyltransferase
MVRIRHLVADRPLDGGRWKIAVGASMRQYLAMCASGFQEVALRCLGKDLQDVKAELVQDGLLVFASATPVACVRALPYLSNAFLVIKWLPKEATPGLEDTLARLIRDSTVSQSLARSVSERERSFRLVLSKENRFVACNPALFANAESWISGSTNLIANRRQADVEFWLMERRDGEIFFVKRITRRQKTEKELEKGELRPEIAFLLCSLSEPNRDDIFLDPFAGSGGIVLARAQQPFELLFASDRNADKVQALRQKVRALGRTNTRIRKHVIVREADALALDRFQNGFVDKIVTDPPWGLFEKTSCDLPDFYARALDEMARVVKNGGAVVVLTAQKAIMEKLLVQREGILRLDERYDVLIAGQKAAVFKIRRLPHE